MVYQVSMKYEAGADNINRVLYPKQRWQLDLVTELVSLSTGRHRDVIVDHLLLSLLVLYLFHRCH